MNTLPSLGKIELDFGDPEPIVLDLDDMVPINESDLSGEFTRQPSLYAYVATLTAQAEAETLDSKRNLERERAEADKRARTYLAGSNAKVTDSALDARIVLDVDYQIAMERESQAKYQQLLLKAVERSMSMRADMLISLGAHLRHEYEQTDMTILDTKQRLEQIRRAKRE